MAEVRKFKQGGGGQIAEAIAKAMGEGVRPVTPGAPPAGGERPKQATPSTQGMVTVSSFFTGDPRFVVPTAPADTQTDEPADDQSDDDADEEA